MFRRYRHAPTLKILVRSVQHYRRRFLTEIHRERREERVRRRLTVAGPRGSRGEESGAQEAGGSSARHQPGAVLGEKEYGAVGRGIPCQGRCTRRRSPWCLEQCTDRRRAFTPRHRCPTTMLPTATNAYHPCRTTITLKGVSYDVPLRVLI